MFRNNLLKKLKEYYPDNDLEKKYKETMINFIEKNQNCFERSLLEGHITGSCWIENCDGTKFLLTRHKKLNLWLQLGGHADGDADILAVAQKEALEESGLKDIIFLSENIFDLGIHYLPQYKNVPPHYHYDVRFLMKTLSPDEEICMSDESTDLNWFDQLPTSNPKEVQEDLSRMFNKWKNVHSSKNYKSENMRGL